MEDHTYDSAGMISPARSRFTRSEAGTVRVVLAGKPAPRSCGITVATVPTQLKGCPAQTENLDTFFSYV